MTLTIEMLVPPFTGSWLPMANFYKIPNERNIQKEIAVSLNTAIALSPINQNFIGYDNAILDDGDMFRIVSDE